MNSLQRKLERKASQVLYNTTVELSVSCRNLKDTDILSKSDPLCVLYSKNIEETSWTEIGRSEIVKNNLNPDFTKKFNLVYRFEELQPLLFEVYDIDSGVQDLKKQDFLGRMECFLGTVVRLKKIEGNLKIDNRDVGKITVFCEETSALGEISLQFKGRKIGKKSKFFGGSPSPFLTISKASLDECSYSVVQRTEYVNSDKNPKWKPLVIPGAELCNGDYERSIKVECHDRQRNGNHKFIGEFYTTLKQLHFGTPAQNKYELINPTKRAKDPDYENSGEVELVSAEVSTFLGYVSGGTELLCTIAIDFTASNGEPKRPSSLHHLNPEKPNEYVRALKAIGEIIQQYDSDKRFPVLGFGAKIIPNPNMPDLFFVHLNFQHDSYCESIGEIIKAYHKCLPKLELSGPTNFAPLIKHVAKHAYCSKDGSKYHILLILTDGVITDMEQTKEAIVQASALPMSIIIVGVGNADYAAMEELDADVIQLSYKGKYADRDIVQFVPFREFENDLNQANNTRDVQDDRKRVNSHLTSQQRLAQAVLAEIPNQFLSYMKIHSIKPKPPKRTSVPPNPQIYAFN